MHVTCRCNVQRPAYYRLLKCQNVAGVPPSLLQPVTCSWVVACHLDLISWLQQCAEYTFDAGESSGATATGLARPSVNARLYLHRHALRRCPARDRAAPGRHADRHERLTAVSPIHLARDFPAEAEHRHSSQATFGAMGVERGVDAMRRSVLNQARSGQSGTCAMASPALIRRPLPRILAPASKPGTSSNPSRDAGGSVAQVRLRQSGAVGFDDRSGEGLGCFLRRVVTDRQGLVGRTLPENLQR
jgi:hypothetical protein